MSIISEEILNALIGTFCKELFTKLREPAVDAGSSINLLLLGNILQGQGGEKRAWVALRVLEHLLSVFGT